MTPHFQSQPIGQNSPGDFGSAARGGWEIQGSIQIFAQHQLCQSNGELLVNWTDFCFSYGIRETAVDFWTANQNRKTKHCLTTAFWGG